MLRRAVLRGLFLLQMRRLMRSFHRDRLLILMYHGFTDEPRANRLRNLEGNHVHVEEFARQVEYLARHHNVVSLEQAVQAQAKGVPLPPYSVVITMDDGYRSTRTLAFPILQRHAVPASIFVTTGFVEERAHLWPDRVEWALDGAEPGEYSVEIDGAPVRLDLSRAEAKPATARALLARLKTIPQERLGASIEALETKLGRSLRDAASIPALYEPLSWEELRTMVASGLVSVGNHTHHHFILSHCTPELQRAEIETAHRLIESRLGIRCRTFCYPNGGREDFDAHTGAILRQLGYICSPTTIPGWNAAAADPFELKRVARNDFATFDDFSMILYGGLRQLQRDARAMGRRAGHAAA